MVRAFGFSEYGGPDVQEFFDIEMPQPMAGELLVEVRAASVNPFDVKLRDGALRDFMPRELPAVLGSEVSGVVREVGQDVESFSVGDEVLGTVASGSGAFAEYTLLAAAGAVAKPPQISFTDAATLPVAVATAYDGVTGMGLEEGQTLLINGASGGVGVAAAQIARDIGLNVVGVAGPDKQALVESLGAIFIPYGDGVAERVREILPNGVDGVFDLAGGDGLRAVADLVGNKSKLISAGDGATAAEVGGRLIERDRTSGPLKIIAGMVAEGKLDPHVRDMLSFDDAADAVAAVEVGHAMGKVVIEIS